MTNDAERVARGQRAERALDEFLLPEFNYVRDQYTRRIVELSGREMKEATRAELISVLAMAIRITNELQNGIVHAIRDGEHAREKMLTVEKMEALSPAKRRLAAIGVV